MKRHLQPVVGILVLLTMAVAASLLLAQRGAEMDVPAEYVPGELLVKFAPGAPAAAVENARRRLGGRHLKTFRDIGVQHWRLGRGVSVEMALEILSRSPHRESLEYAEPNYIVHALDFPNDPRRAELWGLHNIGQDSGTADADIDAPEAWTAQKGSASIIVGVIDTGIDYNHPDLAANIWTNPAEATGIPGVDDDGNGYVDDIRGWDFVSEDNDPYDGNRHGTHVAGTIGAAGNNGAGVAGVNWTVKLMALKFLNDGGSGTNADAIEAILYAKFFGVPVTNNSWGGGGRSRALQDAIASSGALFVAAAGNSGSSSVHYPAGYNLDNILSIAATDRNDSLASFSNFSATWVDLGAPGVDIISTLPNNGYGPLSGTSMAAPHAAGAAALVLAQFPGMPILSVKAQLMNTVDSRASLAGKTVTGGRLNLARAIGVEPGTSTDITAPSQVIGLVASPLAADAVSLSWAATGDDGSAGSAYLYDVRYAAAPFSETGWGTATPASGEPMPGAPGTVESFTVTGLAGATSYYFAVKVVDESGNSSPLSNLASATTPAALWNVEVVEGTGAGFYNSLAFDSSGNPGMAFSASDGVRLARKSGGSWSVQVVDASAAGEGVSVAFDPGDGHPSLSFGWGKLKFADWNGASWSIQTLEKANAYNDVTSHTYDLSGNPAIAYRLTGVKAAIKLARRSGSAWTLEVVEAGAGARYNSLAFDPASGYPGVAYSDDLDRDNMLDSAKFAFWNGASWQIEVIETGMVGYGVFISLAYNPATGQPCVVHSRIRHACRTGPNSWQTEILDAGNYESLAFNSSGEALVSFGSSAGPLRFARRTGGVWASEQVTADAPGWITHLALEPVTQVPAVSYHDSSTGLLKYARRNSP